jgi:hypothetical protein
MKRRFVRWETIWLCRSAGARRRVLVLTIDIALLTELQHRRRDMFIDSGLGTISSARSDAFA